MGQLLRLGTYLFHPLLIPSLAWLLFIVAQPKHANIPLIQLTYKGILVFSLVIPAMLWGYLKISGRINAWKLSKRKQTRIALLLYTPCLIALLYLTKFNYLLPLKAFIYGLLCSIWVCLLLNILKFKVSLNQIGVSALSIFSICLSIYFYENLLVYICILILANGWVASANLLNKQYTNIEIVLGFMLGAIPQLYLVSIWL